jgi:transcription elongation factor Elf1
MGSQWICGICESSIEWLVNEGWCSVNSFVGLQRRAQLLTGNGDAFTEEDK